LTPARFDPARWDFIAISGGFPSHRHANGSTVSPAVRFPPPRRFPSFAAPSRIAIATPQHAENKRESTSFQRLARLLTLALASGGGSGYLPIAPGTWGSALAVGIFVLFSPVGIWQFGLTLVALFFLGIWAADTAERIYGREDDGRIVIDEVAGQLLTFTPLLVLGSSRSLFALVTGFVLFRCFDIWKPGPIRWAERRFEGGAGVMMDDLVAGIFAAMVLAAVLAVLAVLS
jgi:phosphatidylglycerophosphatase A